MAWRIGSDLKSDLAWTLHSSDVLSRSQTLENAVDEMEDAVRRYVSTGTPSAYRAFEIAAAAIPAPAADLRMAVVDNPSQERSAAALTANALAEVRVMSALMARMTGGNRRAMYNELYEEDTSGTRISELNEAAFDRELPQFERAERVLLKERETATEVLWHDAWILLVAGSLAALAITMLFNLTLGRRLVFRLRSLAEQVSQFAKLGRVVTPLQGSDEMAAVSDAIFDMSGEIKRASDLMIRYRLLVEQSRDSIFFFARDGHILEANPAAEKTYGYSPNEFLNMSGFDLLVPEQAAAYAARQWGDSFNVTEETEHRRKDGSTFPVEITMQSARIDDKDLVLGVFRDLTERRAAQELVSTALDQAVEASRLKSVFVATMSHEIRTPMNGVIGMTELLLETALTKEQREYADTVQDSAHALMGIINEILDFSKIEAGRVELEVVDFDLLKHIESIGSLCSAKARDKEISLVTFVDPAIAFHLVGDPLRLRQVLMNFVDNAIKFTAHGSVSLMVNLVSATADTAKVRFAVSDTGIGIDAAKVPALFEAFRQADGSTTRKYGGTGLGLAISKSLVELMGGTIDVSTRLGLGSKFSFTLDFRIGARRASLRRELSGIRALLVTDDAVSREIMSRYVASWNIPESWAGSAAEALQILRVAAAREEPFDIAIVDMFVSEADGAQFARTVRDDRSIDSTRLVQVVPHDAPERGAAAILAGFNAYLVKPVRQSQLYNAIVETLRSAVAERESEPVKKSPPAAEHHDLILLAEDNAVNREVATRQFAQLGYSAEVVVNGKEAVDKTQRTDFDLVFMDCQMPVMDGFQATGAIRNREIRTGKHVPIVAMTANALTSDRDECLAAGMDDYLAKPVVLKDVSKVLNRWLGDADGDILSETRPKTQR
jgi:two-component system, sensor histidine kinase and response regulator